jgi:hypothetical protein
VDTDAALLRAELPATPFYFVMEENHYTNSIMNFPPAHPLLAEAARLTREAGDDVPWTTTGPTLLTALIGRYELQAWAASSEQGCPFIYKDVPAFFDPARAEEMAARELVVIHASVLRDVASHWHPHGSGAADRIIPRCAVSRVRSRHSFSGQDRSAQLKVWVANAKAKEQLETSLEAARADFKSAKAAAKAHLESYRLMVERSRWSRLGRLLGIGPTARRPWRWTASELVRYREQSSAAFDRQHRTAQ